MRLCSVGCTALRLRTSLGQLLALSLPTLRIYFICLLLIAITLVPVGATPSRRSNIK